MFARVAGFPAIKTLDGFDWADPEGSRPFIGALLLAYYDPDGRLIYAGRVGSGMRAD